MHYISEVNNNLKNTANSSKYLLSHSTISQQINDSH